MLLLLLLPAVLLQQHWWQVLQPPPVLWHRRLHLSPLPRHLHPGLLLQQLLAALIPVA